MILRPQEMVFHKTCKGKSSFENIFLSVPKLTSSEHKFKTLKKLTMLTQLNNLTIDKVNKI